jgi:hypothetical protein
MSNIDFDVVIDTLKHVVVGEEVQCFYFQLPRDIKHKPMDVRLLTNNADEEEGQEKSTSADSENLDVFKDACNIADIKNKYSKCFADKMKRMRQEMYHIRLRYTKMNPLGNCDLDIIVFEETILPSSI